MGTEERGKGVAAIGGEGCARLSAAGKVQVRGVWDTGLLGGGESGLGCRPQCLTTGWRAVEEQGGGGDAVDACGQEAQTEDGRAGLTEKSAYERAVMPGVMCL